MARSLAVALACAFLCGIGSARGQNAADDAAWDVSRPPAPHRTLAFTVSEGTWLSCDVSPDGTEIVLDLLGDIYLLPLEGGDARRLRGGVPWDVQPRWSPDGNWISFTSDAGGGDNIWIMRRDGTDARAVTEEKYRLLNNATWHPDGRWLVARKHFTGSRSLGAGEMWMYPVTGGPGMRLTERRNDQQDAGEPVFSPDGRHLYWSEDVSPGSGFEYNKDPHGQIYVINQKDLETGDVVRLVTGPGGAVRPQPSPDGRHLAFVRRVGLETTLQVRDLETGLDRVIDEGLSQDSQETWSLFGVYPGFSWTPDGQALVYWARGGLRYADLDSGRWIPIPFRAEVELEIAETLRIPTDPWPREVEVTAARQAAVRPDGGAVAWQALGRIWTRTLPDGEQRPLTEVDAFEYFPAWSPDGQHLAWCTWDDQQGGRLRIMSNGAARDLIEVPGHYRNPAFSPDGQWIVYERVRGDGLRGSAWVGETGVWRVSADGGEPVKVSDSGSDPVFSGDGERILLNGSDAGQRALISVDRDGHDRRVLARSKEASELSLSPDGRWLAFTELWNAYVCPFPETGGPLEVSRTMRSVPLVRISRDASSDLQWSAGGDVVWHTLADTLREQVVPDLFEPPFGTREPGTPLPEDPGAGARRHDLRLRVPADVAHGTVLLTNARIVTLNGEDVFEDGALLIRDDTIAAVGPAEDIATLAGGADLVVDCEGGTLVPGFVDVHAHIRHGSGGILPERNWQHLLNLGFGVTTTHDPSNDTPTTFAASELQRVGRIVAPRILSTGTILYGADTPFRAQIDSLDDAIAAIRRTAAWGAFTVKSYNQPRRDQRQQVIEAGRRLGVMVVPEGGSTLQHNLYQIVDGHTTIEHALPVAPLYDDVLTLFAESGTAYTPTLIVGYGGLWGENWWYARESVWEHPRLRRFMPVAELEARSRRRPVAADDDYHHLDLARSAAEILRRGGIVETGAHGQLQGLGFHWELWMLAQGGLTPLEALRCASLEGARALGLDARIGSLQPGKLADIVLLRGNPLEDIRHTEDVDLVILGGRIYDPDTLDQIHPDRAPMAPGPRLQGAEPVPGSAGCLCGRH